jgi:hypothetical protein
VWHISQLPCERTLRAMIRRGMIPHYQISGMLFFQPDEVRHAILAGTLVEEAA